MVGIEPLHSNRVRCHRKRKPPAIKAVPAARPSMLSSKLNALVMPRIQRIESIKLTVWEGVQLV